MLIWDDFDVGWEDLYAECATQESAHSFLGRRPGEQPLAAALFETRKVSPGHPIAPAEHEVGKRALPNAAMLRQFQRQVVDAAAEKRRRVRRALRHRGPWCADGSVARGGPYLVERLGHVKAVIIPARQPGQQAAVGCDQINVGADLLLTEQT